MTTVILKEKRCKNLLRSIILLSTLLLATLPARGQVNYVFVYNNNYYIKNNDGTLVSSTGFTPGAVWIASNTLGTTGRTVQSYTEQTKYLYYANSQSGNLSLNTNPANWFTRNNTLCSNRSNSNANAYYPKHNGANATISQGNNGNRYSYYTVNITTQEPTDNTTLPTISVASTTSNTITFNHTDLTGTFVPAYTRYVFNNTTHNWYNDTDHGNTEPSAINVNTLNPNYTWSLTANGGGVATINATTGVVTLSGAPTGNITVRLTVSNISPLTNKTVDFTLTRGTAAQATNTVSTINSFSVSPSSAALYVSENQAFTASATVNNTTYTTPAHTTLTGGGNTYRYYNGTLYTNTEDFSSSNSTTATPTYAWSMTGAGSGNASLSATSGANTTLTHTPGVDADKALTLTVEASYTGATPQTRSVQVNLYAPFVAPTITRSGNNISLSIASLGATIYYTTDGSTPSPSNGTVYTGPFSLEELSLPVTVKAIAVRGLESTPIAQQTYNTLSLEKPVISITSAGAVTITCASAGATIRYTTDGTNPTSSSGTVYSGSFNVANLTTVKAIAYKAGYDDSEVASETYITSGISDGVVILNDYEPHSWSYYSDASTPEQLHSLNPADVKITYYGNGIVMTGSADYTASSTDFVQPGNANYVGSAKVNVGGEDENTFVYYKTLERENADGTGRCPYKPIPNPFQVRPTYGSTWDGNNTATWTGWRGFQCWRLKSVSGGSVYSVASGGTALTTGAVINAETEIYFAPTAEYGMEVELEAVWAIAYVVKANGAGANAIQQQNVGYERNFIVLHSTNSNFNFGEVNNDNSKRITNIDYPATVSTYYPDGTQGANAGSTLRGAAGTNLTLQANTKFENIPFSMGSYTITAANHDVIIGRGCTGTVNLLQGISGNAADLDYTMRIESGTINQLAFIRDAGTNASYTVSGTVMVKAILGCDYDRATNTNTNLSVSASNTLFFVRAGAFSSEENKDKKVFDCVVKSGEYQKSYWTSDETSFTYTNSMYCGHNFNTTTNTHYPGARYVTIEGGQLGNINGGRGTGSGGNNENPDATSPQTDAWNIAFSLRIKYNAIINGCIFGGAANTSAWGSKRIVLTGGKVYSWIAGGANGTNTTNGDSRTRGTSYIYVGGNAEVGGPNARMKNNTLGGQVFGAGRGNNNQAASMDTSNVVIADNAKIMKKNNDASGNVYGGGNIGYIHKQANIYILGGTIEGSVYGGAYNNALDIPEVNITMTSGLVEGGVYGGSNSNGTISGNVTMHIDGGQVGTSSVNANVHGGGLGQPTVVTGNVSVTLGASTSATDSATVNGNVYGGSALGDVNTNGNNTTTVTMNKALINGNLFGGAYGNGADVNGHITVNVLGGRVNGSVFGGGDAAAYGTAGWNFPVVNMSGGQATNVFGGGKGNTATVTGNPQVTLSGNAHVTGNVYGGGDAAQVSGSTNVKVQD